MSEFPLIFESRGNQLVGIHHHANKPSTKGVIIVVGGPQTKFGSHRQFVHLARYLALQGIDVFRFDYTGAGDSEGDISDFSMVVDDIDAAISCFIQQQPSLACITLWGLCDAASAIAMYLAKERQQRVENVILLNPWVRQPVTQAKTYLRNYYWQRILQKSFWQKVFSGKFQPFKSAVELKALTNDVKSSNRDYFVDVMLKGLSNFEGNIHIIQSGNDITGQEFKVLLSADNDWQKVDFASYAIINGANHTFSKQLWKQQVADITLKAIISS